MNTPTSPPETTAGASGPSPRQALLGLFVLGQLSFLVVSNLLGLYRETPTRIEEKAARVADRLLPGFTSASGNAWKVPEELQQQVHRWEQLTGQDQRWMLFAPTVYKATGFPALVLVWEDDPAPAIARGLAVLNARDGVEAAATIALLGLHSDELDPPRVQRGTTWAERGEASPDEVAALVRATGDPPRLVRPMEIDLVYSDNEPVDTNRFFRFGNFRIRRYENSIIPYPVGPKNETEQARRERWQGDIRTHVSTNADQIFAYMKWRLAAFRQRNPDRPMPHQVLLVARISQILPPGGEPGRLWDGPGTIPIVRWQPQAAVPPGRRPLERFDPVTWSFESIPQ
jgi:hypothetical protein